MVEGKAAGTFFRWRTARSELRLAAALLFWLALLVFGAAPARAASFTALLDRDTITLGEQATLSLKFDGVQPENAPALPAVAGLQFQYVGPSSSFSFINGQTSSSITYNYIVAAQRDGEFTIPAMKSDVDGQQLSSHPIKLAVLKANAPSAGRHQFRRRGRIPEIGPAKATGSHRRSPCQPVAELCLRDDVQNFGNFRLTATPADGFSIGKLAEAPAPPAAGRQPRLHHHTDFLRADRHEGRQLSLGPFTANVVVVLPSSNQGGDPFFRQFFNQGDQKQFPLATEQVKVQSLPLPAENVPTNFNGAIGNYTLAVTAGPTNIAVGDPVTVRVEIAGRGALDAIKLPDQSNWSGFKLFAPSSKVETSDQLGVEGTKTFEEIVTPQNADVRELPPLAFSFFNPDDGKYHTLTQPAMPLAVRSAASTPMPAMAANQNSAPQNEPQQDILPIKQNLGTLASSNAPLITKPAFLAAQSLPVLAFLAAFVWRKRADSLANNPRLRRQRAVAQLVASGMDDLKKYAAANQPDEFFATLFRLLQEQLGERLDCPASAITENVIEEHTVLRGAPKATLDALRDQFQLCNQARYARVRGSSELNSVAAQFEKLIGQLREVKA